MEEWNKMTFVLSFSWLLVWIGFGAFALYSHNILLPYIFLACALAIYTANAYLACTRCYYFGKGCYILGGLFSSRIFKARRQGPVDPDDAIVGAIWFILGVFPLPFLIYYQDWLLALIYLAVTAPWFYYRKRVICSRCKTEWCPNK